MNLIPPASPRPLREVLLGDLFADDRDDLLADSTINLNFFNATGDQVAEVIRQLPE